MMVECGMEQPPLTQAPLDWLKTVIQDCQQDPDEKTLGITIKNAEDGGEHTFTYVLGDIRSELARRQSN